MSESKHTPVAWMCDRKAAALLLAEIERLDRAALAATEGQEAAK